MGIDCRQKLSWGPWEAQEQVVVKILRSGGLEEEEEEEQKSSHGKGRA